MIKKLLFAWRKKRESRAMEGSDMTVRRMATKTNNLPSAGLFHDKPTVIVTIVMNILLLGVTLYTVHHQNVMMQMTSQAAQRRDANMWSAINDLRSPLEQLSASQINGVELKAMLVNMDHTLHDLNALEADSAKTADIQKISVQLTGLQKAFNPSRKKSVSRSAHAQRMTGSLPFRVLSVDVIGGQPFASLEYRQRLIPLGLGESLAGWTVTRLSYDLATVTFENKQKRHIVVRATP